MPRTPTKQQNLINKLVTIEFSIDKYFWSRETKIANILLKKYPADFLAWVKPPNGYKVNSLLFFLSKEGLNYLSEQLVEFTELTTDFSPKFPSFPLKNDKIDKDIVIKKQPKTLQEFLQIK